MEGGEEPEAVHEGVSGSGRSDGEQRESAQCKRVIGAEVVPAEGCPLAVGAPSAAVHGIGGFQRVFHAPPHERGDSAQVIGKANCGKSLCGLVRTILLGVSFLVAGAFRLVLFFGGWGGFCLFGETSPETMVVLGLRAAVQAFNALLMACPRRTNCGIRRMIMEIIRPMVGKMPPSAPITLSEPRTASALANHCITHRSSSAIVAALA